MSGPPSTLRTHAPPDPATQSLHEDVAPSLQQLIRLQIFTPLTLLLALGAQLVTTFAIHPNIGQISDDYITIWTARKEFVGGYLLLMYVLQICYCLVITLSKSAATREMVVSGVGLRFCLANLFQAAWAIFWVLRQFLISEIMLLCAGFLMLTIWLTLLKYPYSYRAPVSTIFIHFPVRMMLLFYVNLAIWQNGLIALDWYKYVGNEKDHHAGRWEKEHETHAWIAFGALTGLGLINAFIVFLGKDVAWAACTIFLFVSILIGNDKPVQVVAPLILTASLQAVALVAGYTWALYEAKKRGPIRLPEEEEEERFEAEAD